MACRNIEELQACLAIITEVDGTCAACWEGGVIGSHDGPPEDFQRLLVAGHADAHMVGEARAHIARVCGVVSGLHVVGGHHRIPYLNKQWSTVLAHVAQIELCMSKLAIW